MRVVVGDGGVKIQLIVLSVQCYPNAVLKLF